MSRRRGLAAVVVVLVLAAAVVAVGRWEGRRAAARENAGMQTVLAAIGPPQKAVPTGWRVGPPDCVAFSTPQNLLGLQLCFDSAGKLVETVDRRGAQPVYSSLVYDPAAATLALPRTLIDRWLPQPSG